VARGRSGRARAGPADRADPDRLGHRRLFFELSWAYWLKDLIPGVAEVVEIDGARLFFPDERAGELVAALRAFWQAQGRPAG